MSSYRVAYLFMNGFIKPIIYVGAGSVEDGQAGMRVNASR